MELLLLLLLTALLQCNGEKNESAVKATSDFEVKFAYCSFKICGKELNKMEKPNLTEEEVRNYYDLYLVCRDECFDRISTSEADANKVEKFRVKEYEKLMKKRKQKEEERKEKIRKEAEKRKKQMEKEEEKKGKQVEEPTDFEVKFAYCSFKICGKELNKMEKPNLTEEEVRNYYDLYLICRDECFDRISTSKSDAKKVEKFRVKEYEKLMKKRKQTEEERKEKIRKEAEKRKKQMKQEERKRKRAKIETVQFVKKLEKQKIRR
ncbi:hypothetical protein T4B_14393 [Trichinella pseudospiralis]|uniref:Uncharacterized protein n=1 Tax=Trichinella pseudospiralis TaxID=6337 RepID=A0A0V1EVV9_TRIPS|nr:hypothetical protein T4A_4819 [Trichinella pseudospiralis]KRZ28642.1 hypothetical protein T4B_14393 [Trichinella pseudospiralis]KRZ44441.1 hypothetical protein T4C_2225 [Trichinella pseudospiralis]